MSKRKIHPAASVGMACIAGLLLVHLWPAAPSSTADGVGMGPPARTMATRPASAPPGSTGRPGGKAAGDLQPLLHLQPLLQELREMEDSQKQKKLVDPAFQARLANAAGNHLREVLGQNNGPAIGGFQNLMSEWIHLDPSGARAWIAAQPPDVLVDRLVEQVAMNLALRDPTEAAIFVVENIPAGPVQNEAVISVLHHLIQQDPGSAVAWVEVFPPGELRDQAWRELSEIDVHPSRN